MSQVEVDKIIPQSGTTLTVGESGDTITIPSGATLDTSNSTVTLPDGSVTSAKLSYPLTTFSSTGIDDNATSTAITIDSSQNVGIGIASPSTQLHLSSSNPTVSFTDGASTATISGDSANLTYTTVSTNRDHFFKAGATNLAEINGDGNFKFNSGYGSVVTAYGCRAWVAFNGTGTVSIRGSGNVTSITDRGTGQYTVNLTTAMPDTNYAVLTTPMKIAPTDDGYIMGGVAPAGYTTSAIQVTFQIGSSGPDDVEIVGVAIFR